MHQDGDHYGKVDKESLSGADKKTTEVEAGTVTVGSHTPTTESPSLNQN